jgi:PAS domain S-box-containing protein
VDAILRKPIHEAEPARDDTVYRDSSGVTLVSKTDLKGVITYANEAFVEISGYTLDELLGRSHNIVRHPDMPPAAFEDMWRTLQNGKPWRGIVKNRCKDGGYYWVDACVVPITRHDQVIGYMSAQARAGGGHRGCKGPVPAPWRPAPSSRVHACRPGWVYAAACAPAACLWRS